MAPLHRFLALSLFFASILTAQSAISAGATDNDTKAAIDNALQQHRKPDQLAGRITNLVRSAEYEKAESILSDLLISKPIDIDGYRLLEKVYRLLSFSEDEQVLDQWCENRPSSHFPFAIRGMHYYERASLLDGSNQTLLLNAKQRRDFKLFLRTAQSDLRRAYELNPDDPGPSAALAALSIQLNQPRSEMEQWFARGVAADPMWLGSYQAKLIYLAPWRYGSDQMMAQFAVQCFDASSPELNTFIITLDWIELNADQRGTSINGIRFLTDPDIYPLLSAGLNRLVTAFPLSPRIETLVSLKDLVTEQPYVSAAAFSDALQQNPENTDMLRGRISSYLASNQIKAAEADINSLESLEGPSPFSRVSRAEVLYRGRQDLDAAARLYDQAIADETSSYRRKHYLLDRAEINRNYGRWARAIDDYTAAISEDILFEEAYLGRAQCHYARGNLDAALADLLILKSNIKGRLANHARSLINTYMKNERGKLAARKSKKSPVSKETARQLPVSSKTTGTVKKPADNAHRKYLVRGLHRFYQKDYETARREFYRTLAANPASAQAYFMLGAIAEQVDLDYTKARVFYERAFEIEPAHQEYLLGVSRSRYRDRDFSAAVQVLTDYLDDAKKSPINSQTNAQLYFLRGLCLEELKRVPEALNDMEEALRLDPQLKAAAAFIKDHTAQPRAADIAVQPIQYVSREQHHPKEKEIQRSLEKGRQAIREGDADQARISFVKVIRLNPLISEAYYQLGRISFEFDHDYPAARHYYSLAIKRDPDNPQYYFDRAAIHYFFRQYDLASADFTKVLDLQPNNEQSLYYRGVCNHMLGNTDAARRDFNALRRSSVSWNTEIERFRNAWNTEIEQFLNPISP